MSDLGQILTALMVLAIILSGVIWYFRGPAGVSKEDKAKVHDRDYTSRRINETKSSYDNAPRD